MAFFFYNTSNLNNSLGGFVRYQFIVPFLFLSLISSLHAAEVITQISSEDGVKDTSEAAAEKPAEPASSTPVETVVAQPAEVLTQAPVETEAVKTAELPAEKPAEIAAVAVTEKPAEPVVEEPAHSAAAAKRDVYTVWRVYNADMLRLREDEKLVLAGIDSPEYFLNGKQYKDASRAKIELKTMRWAGKQASKYMRSLVQGRKISVETLSEPRDSRGRLVGYAFLNDGTFVNAEMVRAGYARVTTRGDQDQYQKQLLKLQDEARENNRGLWAYGIFQKLNA